MRHYLVIPLLGATLGQGVSAATVQTADLNREAISILHQRCFSCHNEEDRKGGLILTSSAAIMSANEEFPLLISGHPEKSALIEVLEPGADPHMPPKEQLPADEISLLSEWIKQGAPWSEDQSVPAQEAPPPIAREALKALPSKLTPTLCLDLSPDESQLALSVGNQIRITTETESNSTSKQLLTGHRDLVRAVAWAPNDQRQLISGGYRRIVYWDTDVSEPLAIIEDSLNGQISALRVTPDGSQVWAASSRPGIGGEVICFSLPDFQIRHQWRAHDDSIYGMDLSTDGNYLVTASGDRTLAFWETDTGALRIRIEAHGTQIMDVSFSPDTQRVVTAGTDNQLRVWAWEQGDPLFLLGRHQRGLFAVHWTQDGKSLFAGDERGALFRYTNIQSHSGAAGARAASEKRLIQWADSIQCLTCNRAGTRIYVGSQSGIVRVVDQNGKLLREIPSETPPNAPKKS